MKIVNMEVTYLGGYGSDVTVVNAARVSFAKEATELGEGDERLIRYLAVHKHHSPFNHSFLSFRVKAPIFVARQLVKHKFMPWNEVSRRYVDEPPEFYIPDVFRGRSENVKQGSGEPIGEQDSAWYNIAAITQKTLDTYDWLLRLGVCPEQARMVLPQNTMTEWIWSGTLGAFLDMLKLRLDPHTQEETQEVAWQIAEFVEQKFPISYKEYLGA